MKNLSERKGRLHGAKGIFVMLTVISAISHCGSTPKTATEYRKAVDGHMLANNEKFETNRPYAEVSRIFKKKANECLNYTLNASRSGSSNSFETARVKTVVTSSAKHTELQVLLKNLRPNVYMAEGTPDGAFWLVADAYPAEKGHTRVEIYRGSGVAIAEAIKGWANGEERGCPDPLKTWDR
jgi:hypothetical protein